MILTPLQTQTIYSFMTVFAENPRISIKELYRKYSKYRAISTIEDLLRRARDNQILLGPRIFVNAHVDVELLSIEDRSRPDFFKSWEKAIEDPKVTYACMLGGAHQLLVFKRGATILTYAEAVKPSYPARKKMEEICPTKIGALPNDPYPNSWNEMDWEVYKYMSNPLVPFSDVGKKLGVSWQTVKNHFEKILKDCKIWQSFFPRGLQNYYHTFLTFETDYEIGLREELTRVDRSSFLYKFGKEIILFAYWDRQDFGVFFKLEKEGIIRDLRVSAPVQWHRPDIFV